jgi:hypothetical protein
MMAPVGANALDTPVPPVGQLIATIFSCLLAVAAISYVVVLFRRERIVWPVFVLLSGVLTSLMEPFFDLMYGLHFYREGQWNLYTTFGSAQPVWVPICYSAFYGSFAIIVARTIARAPTMRTVWRMYASCVAMAVVAEMIFVSVLGVYGYQDSQPFVVFGYPIFLAFTNAMSALVGGIVIYRLVPHVDRGLRRLSLVTIIPQAFAMGLFGTGILYLSVRHSVDDPPMWLVSVAALTVVGGIAATVKLLGQVLVADAPRSQGVVREPVAAGGEHRPVVESAH